MGGCRASRPASASCVKTTTKISRSCLQHLPKSKRVPSREALPGRRGASPGVRRRAAASSDNRQYFMGTLEVTPPHIDTRSDNLHWANRRGGVKRWGRVKKREMGRNDCSPHPFLQTRTEYFTFYVLFSDLAALRLRSVAGGVPVIVCHLDELVDHVQQVVVVLVEQPLVQRPVAEAHLHQHGHHGVLGGGVHRRLPEGGETRVRRRKPI